jgi:hypothetical protein
MGRLVDADRPPARTRVAAEVGEELTQLLLATLQEAEPSTPHEEQARRAASGGAA